MHAVLALPDALPVPECETLLDWLQRRLGARFEVHGARGSAHASHLALALACQLAGQSAPAQTTPPCLLLAADSLCTAQRLEHDLRQGLLMHRGDDRGWIAGEAAAGLWLALPSCLAPGHMRNRLLLHPPAVLAPFDRVRLWPSAQLGEGRSLQTVMQLALSHGSMRAEQVGHWLSDDDGSAWRAEHRMAAVARMDSQADAGAWRARPITPADHLGQLGAATGAVQWAWASEMQRLDLTRINTALSSVMDADGACAANLLERAIA